MAIAFNYTSSDEQAIACNVARLFGQGLQRGAATIAIAMQSNRHAILWEAPFTLLCSYPIDIFDSTVSADVFDAIVSAHTHLLPSDENDKLPEPSL